MELELELTPLDLDLTLGCGQTFRWNKHPDGSWVGVLADELVRLSQEGSIIKVEATPGTEKNETLVTDFLRSQDDIARIQRELRRDRILAPGIARMKGLRIVKLDEWECLVSFVLATYANIPRIAKMVESIASAYGRRISSGAHSFPDRRMLSKASVRDLEKLGLGYRAKYVHDACEVIDDDEFHSLSHMNYDNLRTELVALPGVGDKVADCVSLFGFGKLEAFPIDVWMHRAMSRLYDQRGNYSQLRKFAMERFGQYAGYAQEYIYHNERMRSHGESCVFLK